METNEINMYPKEVSQNEIIGAPICFCCEKQREGIFIDNKFICNKCNHLPNENKVDKNDRL